MTSLPEPLCGQTADDLALLGAATIGPCVKRADHVVAGDAWHRDDRAQQWRPALRFDLADGAFQRHPLSRWFAFAHLPERLQPVSIACAALAEQIVDEVGPDASEAARDQLEAGLRKLIEAKDCFVRAVLAR